MLLIVVVLGVTVQTAALRSSALVRADREAELLFRGLAYVQAIRSYYLEGVPNRFPRNLADLLKDPRFLRVRHIRALYTDPIRGGDGGWLLIPAADGGIAGVTSASESTPTKQANFPLELEHFEGAQSYRDWTFEFLPTSILQPRR